MHLIYAKKIGLFIQRINFGTQMINSFGLDTFGIVIAAFLINDKDGKINFFEKTFLLANISLDEIFEMLFLTLSNADVRFLEQ